MLPVMAENTVFEKQKSATETEQKAERGRTCSILAWLNGRGADGPADRAAKAHGQPRMLPDVFDRWRTSLLL